MFSDVDGQSANNFAPRSRRDTRVIVLVAIVLDRIQRLRADRFAFGYVDAFAYGDEYQTVWGQDAIAGLQPLIVCASNCDARFERPDSIAFASMLVMA